MSTAKPSDFPIVLLKNFPYNTSSQSLFELLGKFGDIHQLRTADPKDASSQQGTCFVVYHNLESAVQAAKELNGVNFHGRYLVASLYSIDKTKLSEEDFILRKEQLEQLKQQYGIEQAFLSQ